MSWSQGSRKDKPLAGSSKTQPLSAFDRLYLWFFYLMRSFQYDLPENRVGWRSRHNQEIRFRLLTGIGDINGKSILDLGCGLGCFYGYLKARGWHGDYTGMDTLDLMVKGARRRYPGVKFEKHDILENPPHQRWDYLFISGVFNHRVRDNWAWVEQMVGAAFGSVDKGLAFNILSADCPWKDGDLFYADPSVLEDKVKLWTGGKYKIVKGYLPGEDMTVYLYK